MRDATQLKKDVYDLAKPEGRMVGTAGHDNARKRIVQRMQEGGFAPYRGDSFELPYSVEGTDFTNIIGTIKSNFPDNAPLLIGAHYDSVIAAECADDNIAAVVMALAAGEYFISKQEKIERDIVIAIFDAEEPPYFQSAGMGSIRFYEDQMDARNVHAALIMDLVGHDVTIPLEAVPFINKLIGKMPFLGSKKDSFLSILKDLIFITGAESNPEMVDVFQTAGYPKGLRLINALNEYISDMSDHGVFRQNGRPYLFMSCGRWMHYHDVTDTPDKLSYSKMEKILQYLVCLSETMCKSVFQADAPEVNDTTKLEVKSIKKAFAPFTPLILKTIGLEKLESREDIDYIASAILSTGI